MVVVPKSHDGRLNQKTKEDWISKVQWVNEIVPINSFKWQFNQKKNYYIISDCFGENKLNDTGQEATNSLKQQQKRQPNGEYKSSVTVMHTRSNI